MSEKNNGFDVNKAIDQIKGDRNLTIVAAGAVAVIIGLFLPWYTVDFLGFSTSFSPGLGESDGILLLVFSVVALGAGLNVLNQDKRNMSIAGIVAGVLATLIMLRNWPDDGLGDVVSTGVGYWLTLAGSVALVIGSVMAMQNMKAAPKKSAAKPASEEKSEDS